MITILAQQIPSCTKEAQGGHITLEAFKELEGLYVKLLAGFLISGKLQFDVECAMMRVRLFGVTFLLLWLTSCQPPAPAELPSAEIVRLTASRMNEMPGFHFLIDRTGAPAYLDPAETISFRRAEGDYAAPDRARAIVRVIAPGLVTDVSVVSVADIQWQTNVLTGQWEELPPDWGFNPAVLFDAEVGLQAILTADLSNLRQEEPVQLEDGPEHLLYVINGDAAGQRVYQVSGGLIGPDQVMVTLWVMPETFELYRVLVTEPAPGEDEPSIWQVDFTDFDQQLEIDPPDMEQN